MKRIYKYLVILLCSAGAFSACEQVVDLPLPEYERQLATYSVLTLGEHPNILVNESSSYFDPIDRRDIINVINNASVIISEGSNSYVLEFDTLSYYTEWYYDSEQDEWIQDSIPFGSYTTDAFVAEVNKDYNLEISHDSRLLSGSTRIPNSGEILSSSHEVVDIEDIYLPDDWECWAIGVDVTFTDTADSNFYEIIWFQEYWQKDCGGGDSCLIDRYYWGTEWLSDESFNGTEVDYSTQVGYYCDPEGAPDPGPDPEFWTIYEMTISTLSKEAYAFKTSMDQQWDSEDNPFSEPVPLSSTVEGGIGLFGSRGQVGEPIRIKYTF